MRDREMALVKRRGTDDAESFAVWSDLYVTDSMDHVAAAVDSADAKTRALARAFLEGSVLGISAWPGRELCENDKAHVVDKANAHALRASLGLDAADAALLQQAAPPAFTIGGDDATVAKLVDERERWVVKARFGCGGNSVIVGAKASWPAQRLPRIDARDGQTTVTRVAIADIARDADVALEFDGEGRIEAASWSRLWPHLVRFVAGSPGYYVAQARVEPATFNATIFDGRRIDIVRGDDRLRRGVHARLARRRPAPRAERNAVPGRTGRPSAHQHHHARRADPGHVRGRVRPALCRARARSRSPRVGRRAGAHGPARSAAGRTVPA